VLQQTFQDFEIVVVDDGSIDGTRDVIFQFQSDKRIRYIYQENRGRSAARNVGIRESRGEYIAFLDADDVWLPQKLERQIKFMETHHDVDVVYCGFNEIDASGRLIPANPVRTLIRKSLYEELMYRNIIAGSNSAVVLRARCFEEVGLFDEGLFAWEDLDMWRRLALAHKFLFLDEILVCLRWHDSNTRRDIYRMALGWEQYLSKMMADTPPEYRHHLPSTSARNYLILSIRLLLNRKYLKSASYLFDVMSIGSRHPLILARESWEVFIEAIWTGRMIMRDTLKKSYQ
jgi:glycosyltransferase involved in cell wall biosynthesis